MPVYPRQATWSVGPVRWQDAADDLLAVRRQVFIVGQRVPEAIEIDGQDPACRHVLGRDADGGPIATGRLQADGRIGRLAVLAPWRGQGVGAAVLAALLAEARLAGLGAVYLHAQLTALGFYERAGFVAHGPVFQEAEIAHREMRRRL